MKEVESILERLTVSSLESALSSDQKIENEEIVDTKSLANLGEIGLYLNKVAENQAAHK